MNHMENKKLPIKASFLKSKVGIIHFLLTWILFPRKVILNFVIKEDVVPLWIIIKKFKTNWVEGIFLHMIYCKETQTDGFPYGGLITKLLGAFNINTMGEAMESLINNI